MSDFIVKLRQLVKDSKEAKIALGYQALSLTPHQIEIQQQAAQPIISKLKERAEKEAAKGKTSMLVMKLDYGDQQFERPPFDSKKPHQYSPYNLAIKARTVYDYCANELGITPTITWQHDGVGMEDWYEMIIDWS
jgi:hypothetical protein